jgi:hypothetical protein
MATEANKGILKGAGLLTPQAAAASPNDLVIAVNAAEDRLASALVEAEKFLHQKQAAAEGAEFRPKTLHGALKANPAANVAVISVSGGTPPGRPERVARCTCCCSAIMSAR